MGLLFVGEVILRNQGNHMPESWGEPLRGTSKELIMSVGDLLLLLGWLGPIHAVSDGQETRLWGGGVVANVALVGSR